MKYFDQNSDPTRIPAEVRPLIRGFLANTQIFGPNHDDPPRVTKAIKYTDGPQNRRQTSEYTGDDAFVQDIVQFFDFEPLDFQVTSWRQIRDLDERRQERDTSQGAIFSAPTGFGKTEAFLGPLYQLLGSGDQDLAILVYPSRALLQDQLGRILEHLHTLDTTRQETLSVGVWTGDTPYSRRDVESEDSFFTSGTGMRRFKLADCWCGGEETHSFTYEGGSSSYQLVCEHDDTHAFSDREILLNRRDIIDGPGPDLLLTTLESLELFSLKPNYPIIERADTIVFDEIHLYTGLRGAHTANIAQNIEAITDQSLLWLGSSATVDDPARFANDLFPVPSGSIEAVSPPDSDYRTDHDDKERYYFLKTAADGPGVSSMAIQQLLLLGHGLLDPVAGDSGKMLSFIDSISQVNQKRAQLEDADHDNELWQFHRTGTGPANWGTVADEMGYQFRAEPLSFQSVYSDEGFDAAAAAESDVLLSTSFLEVGIDVGDITIVTQYRTPWNLSSFIQRAGRAARTEGTDSHIVVFLSDLTQDANMFYRADRFLGSEIRTPLKTDNHVIAWIHDQFETFYEITTAMSDEWFESEVERKETFLERFLNEALGYGAYYEFITDPTAALRQEFGLDLDADAVPTLHGEQPVEMVSELLSELQSDLTPPELATHVQTADGRVTQGEDLAARLMADIREDFLIFCQDRQALVDVYRDADVTLAQDTSEQVTDLESTIEDLRTTVLEAQGMAPPEQLEEVDALVPELYAITATVERLVREADSRYDDISPPSFPTSVDELADSVDTARRTLEEGTLETTQTESKQIYYLQQTLDQLAKYNSIGTNFKSLYYVKFLLRGAYYFDRFLRADGRSLNETVWYVPPNYFQDAGQYLTVFYGDDDHDGNEESVDKIAQAYAPYRSEYQQEAGHLQAFLPPTVVDDETVRFDFDHLQGDRRAGMIIPDSITLADVNDLSGGRALNIVRYCPECFQILDEDRCLRHNERAYGKIHSAPEVETRLERRRAEATDGIVTLADVTGEVRLTGVSLEITPARPVGDDFEFIFTGEDRIHQEITSGGQPLGFSLDTRGLVFDMSAFVASIGDDIEAAVNRYKPLEQRTVSEVARHTAAHCFTQLVADIGGVNPSMLFYGIDHDEDEVYVFERAQGGQGIVDLVYEDFQTDPGTALDSLAHITYNPQVITERLWATPEFLERVPERPDENTIRGLITDFDEVPLFPDIIDLIVDEVLSATDRATQLTAEEDISIETAYEVKHTVARERVDGNDAFPSTAVQAVTDDIDDFDRVESLFFSPDIDGCVENLHLAECLSGADQSNTLSYVLLEVLREQLIERVPSGAANDRLFDIEAIPGGEFNGTSIFFTI